MPERKLWFLAMIAVLFAACNTDTKNEKPINNPRPDTVINRPVTNPNAPDPKIAVKEDYTQLTGEDIIKEDITHLDISYFPSNYALEKANGEPVQLKIRILYSRASKRQRPVIFGDSSIPETPVKYGKIWRLGANETTEIEFLNDVQISGKKLKKGRYSIFAIPYADKWTLIFNSDLYTWGAFNYDEKKNLLLADVPVEKRKTIAEKLLIYFQKTTTGCNMIMTWDDIQVMLPITIG